MTVFILAGGQDRKYSEYAAQLKRVVSFTLSRPVRLLGCFFSSPPEIREQRFEDYMDFYREVFGDNLLAVNADVDKFEDQLYKADVVYFHGGSTKTLMAAMGKYPNTGDLLQGKLVIGSSAGANMLSKYGFSPSSGSVINGLGLVDASVVVHYGSAENDGMQFTPEFWRQALVEMHKATSDRPLLLCEGQFAIFGGMNKGD